MDFVPPSKVFLHNPKDPRVRANEGTYDIPGFLAPTRTKTGGMASWFSGHPFPRKGFIYGDSVVGANKLKKLTLSLFLPFAYLFKGPIKFLDILLLHYTRLADVLVADQERIPFYHYEYYTEFGKATWDFIYFFLKGLGFSFDSSYKTGQIWATIFDNDDAYKTPLQDVLNEADREKLLANPRKEILRLVEIFRQRAKGDDLTQNTRGERMVKMAKLVSLLLWLPRVKRAFRQAIELVNFQWFKLDESDYYWCLTRSDYNTLGKTFEERREMGVNIMMEFARQLHPGKEVKRVQKENGNVEVIVI